MQLSTYLFFDGECQEAFTHYQRILGGELVTMPYEGSPAEIPPGWENKVMHACLTFEDGQMLMASDAPPDQSDGPMQGVSVSIGVDDNARAERIFAGLAEGGQVKLPIGETFWAERFGMLVDRFGTHWMVSGASKEM